MTREQKRTVPWIVLAIVSPVLTVVLSSWVFAPKDNKSSIDKVETTIAVHESRIDEIEKKQDEHVTKEYFDLAIDNLKEYINKK